MYIYLRLNSFKFSANLFNRGFNHGSRRTNYDRFFSFRKEFYKTCAFKHGKEKKLHKTISLSRLIFIHTESKFTLVSILHSIYFLTQFL